ncbi:MAG: hydroxylase [Acidobacteriota bacterium]|nr:hydroxylase [Acidobacteriota bacterium]
MTVPEYTIYYLEIVTPDIEAACKLYGHAYGWQFEPKGPEWGGSVVAKLPGGSLCGIRAPLHEQENPVVRTYLRVTDIDSAVQEAEKLGATIALPPMEMPGAGKIAIYLFGGIEQGLWQVP